MSKAATTPILVRFPPEQVQALDGWRRDQSDLPTRPEAIRRLVEKALRDEGGGGRGEEES